MSQPIDRKSRTMVAWAILVVVGVGLVSAGIMIPPLGAAILLVAASVGLLFLVGWAIVEVFGSGH